MAYMNENYNELKGAYLFSEIAKRVAAYKNEHPEKDIIRLGIGDVTLPLVPAVVDAMGKATKEMGVKETFRGYGPEQGYSFLKDAILEKDFTARNVEIASDEIFVSDGAKSDTGNIGDIFGTDNLVLIADPAYPVYIDTNVMAGRKIKLLPCTEETGFIPVPPDYAADIIYLCSPNNPTGTVMNKAELKAWVDYAKKHDAVILFDAAYESFIRDDSLPHTIYEIEGAKEVAIEFRSFSKTAGFTGVRCGYTVVPKALMLKTKGGEKVSANSLWNRRHTTKFNGAPYVTQRGAEAVYSEEGQKQVKANIDFYLENAKIIKKGLTDLGYTALGGDNSPYIWLKCRAVFRHGISSTSFLPKSAL